jgi:hypothetical protein
MELKLDWKEISELGEAGIKAIDPNVVSSLLSRLHDVSQTYRRLWRQKKTNKGSWEKLPAVLFFLLIPWLPVHGRKNMSMVCKSFFHIFFQRSLTSRTHLVGIQENFSVLQCSKWKDSLQVEDGAYGFVKYRPLFPLKQVDSSFITLTSPKGGDPTKLKRCHLFRSRRKTGGMCWREKELSEVPGRVVATFWFDENLLLLSRQDINRLWLYTFQKENVRYELCLPQHLVHDFSIIGCQLYNRFIYFFRVLESLESQPKYAEVSVLRWSISSPQETDVYASFSITLLSLDDVYLYMFDGGQILVYSCNVGCGDLPLGTDRLFLYDPLKKSVKSRWTCYRKHNHNLMRQYIDRLESEINDCELDISHHNGFFLGLLGTPLLFFSQKRKYILVVCQHVYQVVILDFQLRTLITKDYDPQDHILNGFFDEDQETLYLFTKNPNEGYHHMVTYRLEHI